MMGTDNHNHHTSTSAREIPRDEHLPGLSTLLDAARARELIAPRVGNTHGTVGECSIAYVRYKPDTSCVVTYALKCAAPDSSDLLFYGKCYTPDDFDNAARKANSQQWVTACDVEPVLLLPELCSIIYTYPNDRELDGLRLIAAPKKMQRMLYEHLTDYPGDEWRISDKRLRATTVRYKPEKRAVVRFDTRATHRERGNRERICVYLRSYSDDRGRAQFELMQKLHASFHQRGQVEVPRPLAYFADKHLLLIDGLPGVPMLDRFSDAGVRRDVARAAQALAELHRFGDADLATRTVSDLMDDARSTAGTLGHVAPGTGAEVRELMAALESIQPGSDHAIGFVHGDFYHGQVLIDEDGSPAILDFDRSYAGDVTADVGNFCAHLRLLALQSRISGWAALRDAFAGAYSDVAGGLDPDRLRFWTALGLFQLSVGPFRSLRPEWRTKTENILKECWSALK
ncbi:MAG: aminoglycoside phosphotransferase family protein [Candidatus Krumholzibacteriia bacterium]